MSHRKRGAAARVLLLGTIVSLGACLGDDDEPVLSGVALAPPVQVPPQGNENIPNPTLTLLDNAPVAAGGGKTLVWSDEFDGDRIDTGNWFFQSGDGTDEGIPGWGNNELQFYLPDNAQVSDGLLRITARQQSVGAFNYTSARIITRDRIAVRYGRIEARIRWYVDDVLYAVQNNWFSTAAPFPAPCDQPFSVLATARSAFPARPRRRRRTFHRASAT